MIINFTPLYSNNYLQTLKCIYLKPLYLLIWKSWERESSLSLYQAFIIGSLAEHKDLFKLFIYWFFVYPFCLKGHEFVVYYLHAITWSFGWCNVMLVRFRTCESFLLQLVYVSEDESRVTNIFVPLYSFLVVLMIRM